MAPLRNRPPRGWTRLSRAGLLRPVPLTFSQGYSAGAYPTAEACGLAHLKARSSSSVHSTHAVHGITVENLPKVPGLHCTIVRQEVLLDGVEDVRIAACAREAACMGIDTSVVGTILIGPADSPGTAADTTALTTVQQTHTQTADRFRARGVPPVFRNRAACGTVDASAMHTTHRG
jgi:hypothetical protein